MRLFFKPLILALLMAFPALGQIVAPQINLTGNIGCQGFPCLNTGTLNFTADANHTMTVLETSAFYIKVISSVSLTATRNLVSPTGRFPFTIENATTGGQSIQIIGSSGTGVTIANGQMASVWNDGTNYVQVSTTSGGSMVWPAGGAGIPNYNGSSAWGTSYSSGNTIPANFISTLNQNTTGNAATANALAANPTLCTTGQAPTGIVANGNATGCASIGGSGTVTHTAGALTANKFVIGNSSADVTVDPNAGTDGAGNINGVSVTLSGGSTHGMNVPAGTALSGATGHVIYASDATNGYAEANENNTGLSRICTAANGICGGTTAAFSALTSGSNTTATMTVGTGASLAPTGSGTVTANALSGLAGSVCIPGSFASQTDAATVTWAIGSSICANASLTFTVHSGSRTLNLTGLVNGGSYVIWLKQDGTGGEGLTLGSGCTWKVGGSGSGAITPSTGASAIDVLAFTYDGTNCYANFRNNFN